MTWFSRWSSNHSGCQVIRVSYNEGLCASRRAVRWGEGVSIYHWSWFLIKYYIEILTHTNQKDKSSCPIPCLTCTCASLVVNQSIDNRDSSTSSWDCGTIYCISSHDHSFYRFDLHAWVAQKAKTSLALLIIKFKWHESDLHFYISSSFTGNHPGWLKSFRGRSGLRPHIIRSSRSGNQPLNTS